MKIAKSIIKYQKYDVDPSCAYCAKGGHDAKCEQKAVKKGRPACRKFRYDPLKRVPQRPAVLEKFTQEDFTL